MNIYIFNGKEVVIVDGNIIEDKTGIPIKENKEVIDDLDNFVIISLSYAKEIGIKEDETNMTEDDFYTGGYCEPKEIEIDYCSLFENKSKKGIGFYSRDYSYCDYFFRKYLLDEGFEENEFDKLFRLISEYPDDGLEEFKYFVAELMYDYNYCIKNLEDMNYFDYFCGDIQNILDSFSYVVFNKLNIEESQHKEIMNNIVNSLK